jgi:ribosomal protein S15P/S13E
MTLYAEKTKHDVFWLDERRERWEKHRTTSNNDRHDESAIETTMQKRQRLYVYFARKQLSKLFQSQWAVIL